VSDPVFQPVTERQIECQWLPARSDTAFSQYAVESHDRKGVEIIASIVVGPLFDLIICEDVP